VGNQRVLLSYGKNETPFEMYRIVWSQAGHVAPSVTGQTVKEVGLSQDGATLVGRLVKVDADNWVEVNASGAALFNFVVSADDGYAVTLRDYSRQIELVLDLQAKTVNGRYPGQPYAQYYWILWAK
jgi:hypothetical protein